MAMSESDFLSSPEIIACLGGGFVTRFTKDAICPRCKGQVRIEAYYTKKMVLSCADHAYGGCSYSEVLICFNRTPAYMVKAWNHGERGDQMPANTTPLMFGNQLSLFTP